MVIVTVIQYTKIENSIFMIIEILKKVKYPRENPVDFQNRR